MKKTAFAFILFLAGMAQGLAQDSVYRARPSSLYFGFGISFPLGTFLAKNFSEPKAGFANAGSNLQVEYQRKVVGNLGAIARLNINSSPYDVYELARSYKNADTSGSVTYSVNSKSWYCIGGLAGLSMSIPIGKKVGLQMKALGGYLLAESPNVKVTVSNGTDSATVTLTSGSASGFVWTAGLGAYYHFTEKWSTCVSVEYLTFSGTFHGSKILVNDQPLSNRSDFSTDIILLNCAAGIRYHF